MNAGGPEPGAPSGGAGRWLGILFAPALRRTGAVVRVWLIQHRVHPRELRFPVSIGHLSPFPVAGTFCCDPRAFSLAIRGQGAACSSHGRRMAVIFGSRASLIAGLVRLASPVALCLFASATVCVAQAPRRRCGTAGLRIPRQRGAEDSTVYLWCAVDRPAQLHIGRLPSYPDLLRSANVSGHVDLRIIIGKDGKVESRTLGVYKSTHELFTDAAKAAVLKWAAAPAFIGRSPVRQELKFEFDFRLDCSKSVAYPRAQLVDVCPAKPSRSY